MEVTLDDLQGRLPPSLVAAINASQGTKAKPRLQNTKDRGAKEGGGGGEEDRDGAGAAWGAEAEDEARGCSRGEGGAVHMFPMPQVHNAASAVREQEEQVLREEQGGGAGGSAAAAGAAVGSSSGAAEGGGGSPAPGSPRKPRVAVVHDTLHVYRLHLGMPVRAVACGALHTLVSLEGGGVLGWGDNASGQATGYPGVPAARMGTPVMIDAFSAVEVVCLSAGGCTVGSSRNARHDRSHTLLQIVTYCNNL